MTTPTHAQPRGGRRRASTVAVTTGITLLAAVLPGSGYLYAGRRLLGWSTLGLGVAWAATTAWQFRSADSVVELAADSARLRVLAVSLSVGIVMWSVTVLTTYLIVRPPAWSPVRRAAGVCIAALLCTGVAAPVAMAARYSLVQADLVDTVFEQNQTATRPQDVTPEDPWGGRRRVNVLLLGGDGGVGRVGIRTDTVILLSMDTRTGASVTFSLPRNLMNAQFPPTSPLHEIYPDGFRGEGDPGSWMLNAVYGQVPQKHPGILGRSQNEGADATKQAVAGTLGIRVDYYVLVNLRGFQQVVDALGGVTVNINQPLPVGGNQDLGIPPTRYLQPGPAQHLDGFEALWFSRGRYGLDDYNRMLRQRCLVQAVIDQADPLKILSSYEDLAAAGKEVVRTDIPAKLLPAFVDLAVLVKSADVKSVVFVSSAEFFPGNPDFDWLRASVLQALKPATSSAHGPAPVRPSESPTATEVEPEPPDPSSEDTESCDYRPTG